MKGEPGTTSESIVPVLDVVSRSADETLAIARTLASRLRRGDVVALDGPLGAGKTCFVRGLAAGLGLDPDGVASPTFVLCREYRDPGIAMVLLHLDGYRLHGPDELESIGWQEMLRADEGVIVVEWAERLGTELPDERIRVEISHVSPDERSIRIAAKTTTARRLRASAPAGETTTRCPICRAPVTRGDETFPFCGVRCRLVDLGKWFNESYCIERPMRHDDLND